MIKHVVMFKVKPEAEADEWKKVLADLRKLPDKIDVIRDYEVGEDVLRSPRSWDAVLVSTFDDLEALQTYARHEDHVEVVLRIQGLVEKVASVDYEF
jgi:hypothetical protein